MSNGGNKQRRGGGGGGGGQQQRRRRSGGGNRQPQAPRGPVMTALGESTYEAVFDHGNEGYGVWFDGVVRDDPMYKQFWKGTGMRPIFVRIDEDRIVIMKELDRDFPGMNSNDSSNDSPSDDDDQDDDGGGDEEQVYSPEEAAALFAEGAESSGNGADADDGGDDDEGGPDAEAAPAPKRRTATRRRTPPKSVD